MSYKLHYFDARGRAEIIRMVFTAADIKFEDVRFTFEEWPAKYKAASPSGQAPYLVDPVTGKTLVQSFAIARLLAKRFGLMSDDPAEYYKIERMLFQLKDVFEAAAPCMFAPSDELKAAAKKKFVETLAPGLLATVEKFLTEGTESKYAVGKALTLADLALINMTEVVEKLGPEASGLLAKYPAIGAHGKHVLESNKRLADYLAARKPSPF